VPALVRVLRSCKLVLLVAGAACGARVQHGLDERQANELSAVLSERGFDARKVEEEGRRPTWAIEVSSEQATDAVRVLAELGLPRPRNEGFREVFKPGLVPDPLEQHVRFLEAAAGELAQTLEAVDGVASARVHLVVPAAGRSGLPSAPAKAAAHLRIRPGSLDRVLALRPALKELIASGVEGLSPDAVTLVVTEVVSSVPAPRMQPVASRHLLLVGALAALALVVGAAIILLARSRGASARRRGTLSRSGAVTSSQLRASPGR
jgi:type III secretion protein J